MNSDRDDTLHVLFSYSRRDEDLRAELDTHLTSLKQEGSIRTWHDGEIVAGHEIDTEIDHHLDAADVILLLISPQFLVECFDFARRALERHKMDKARVIPILLRPVDWETSPFARLNRLPRDGRPVTAWGDLDAAFLDVVHGLRATLSDLLPPQPTYPDPETRELSTSLKDAYRRKAELQGGGQDTTLVVEEILGLKRRIRQGAQLHAGDLVADGRYELLKPIGQGGFARVFKAYDHQGQALVAVKVLHSQYARDRSRRDRFFRGARQMARLQHQHIVRVIEEECEDGGFYFFVMEYVGGGDFRQAVLVGRLGFADRIRVVAEVGEALQFVHERGVIHRDVKPANILLDAAGRSKLTDFDLVRALDTTGGTRTQGMMGTFLYSAPEVLGNPKDAEPSADIFSLGMTVVFAVAEQDLPVTVMRDAESFVRGLDCAPEFADVLIRAVAWESDQRPGSVKAFCRALREAGPAENDRRRVSALFPEGDGEETVKANLILAFFIGVMIASTFFLIWNMTHADELQDDPGQKKPAPEEIVAVQEQAGSLPPHCAEAERDLGIEFLPVPEGWYPIGADDLGDDEDPPHRVYLSAFWIGKTEVTNEQYQRFLANNPNQLKPMYWTDDRFNDFHQPVVGVSWTEALQFSRWAGLSLPTEAQWEAAARGPDGWRYPWEADRELTPDMANFGSNTGKSVPVGSYEDIVGPFGTLDQAGNAWEWCRDVWDGTAYGNRDGARDPVKLGDEADESVLRVLRGGSWAFPPVHLRAAIRGWYRAGYRDKLFGFRVVCDSVPEHGD